MEFNIILLQATTNQVTHVDAEFNNTCNKNCDSASLRLFQSLKSPTWPYEALIVGKANALTTTLMFREAFPDFVKSNTKCGDFLFRIA